MQNPYNNNEKKFPDFFPEQIKIQRRNNHLIGGLPTNQWTDFYNKKTNPVIFKPLNKTIKKKKNNTIIIKKYLFFISLEKTYTTSNCNQNS